MKVSIKNEYTVYYQKDKTYYTVLDLNVDDLLKKWRDEWDHSDWRPNDIDSLKDAILDYYLDGEDRNIFAEDNEDKIIFDHQINDLNIVNIDEIVSKLSYLIVDPYNETCCDKSSKNNFRFCSDCGKQLIY